MPRSTSPIFGIVAAMRASRASVPPRVYLSRHGEPLRSIRPPTAQVARISKKPASLPPMVSVTTRVSGLSASYCGGFLCWRRVMCLVSAPVHDTSVNARGASSFATSEG